MCCEFVKSDLACVYLRLIRGRNFTFHIYMQFAFQVEWLTHLIGCVIFGKILYY